MRKLRWIGAWSVVAAMSAIGMAAQVTLPPESQLRAAQYRERVQGDVNGAIREYQRLSLSSDRNVASNALLALSDAYARLGRMESAGVLARLGRDPDHK